LTVQAAGLKLDFSRGLLAMDEAIEKANVLIEALAYIRRFRGRLSVIKLGGSAMEDAQALQATLQDIVFMETVGLQPVVVHGGGKPIDRAMAAAGLEPRKIRGQRYTDRQALDIVVRVLTDQVNAGIVRQIRAGGGRAVGLHSGTLQCLFGRRPETEADPVRDLGYVGRITRVDGDLIRDFCSAGVVPVIPSLAWDDEGGWLNINADNAAAAVAAGVRSEKLVILTDTPGILKDRKDERTLIRSMDPGEARRLLAEHVIDDGMIPKVEACLDCLEAGVHKSHIVDGRLPHSLLLEIFTNEGIGTEIQCAGARP
jgi:acetylglutamate kinase